MHGWKHECHGVRAYATKSPSPHPHNETQPSAQLSNTWNRAQSEHPAQHRTYWPSAGPTAWRALHPRTMAVRGPRPPPRRASGRTTRPRPAWTASQRRRSWYHSAKPPRQINDVHHFPNTWLSKEFQRFARFRGLHVVCGGRRPQQAKLLQHSL